MLKSPEDSSITKHRIISDVKTVKEEAQHCFMIKDGRVSYLANSNGKLGIIALIGPTHSQKHGILEEAVLCEVGIGRVRPYRTAEQPKNLFDPNLPGVIKSRRNVFSPSIEQYCMAAPYIFDCIQKIADKKINGWHCNISNPFQMRTVKTLWSKKNKNYFFREITNHVEPAVRFSVSHKDILIIQDIHWAEMYGNEVLTKQLKGLASIIGFPLSHYRRLKTKKNFRDLPKYPEMKELLELSKFPQYLKIHALSYLDKDDYAYFFDDLMELFNVQSDKTPQELLSRTASPEQASRTCRIRLRLTHKHSNPNIYVFEVYHSGQLPDDPPESLEESFDDYIPF